MRRLVVLVPFMAAIACTSSPHAAPISSTSSATSTKTSPTAPPEATTAPAPSPRDGTPAVYVAATGRQDGAGPHGRLVVASVTTGAEIRTLVDVAPASSISAYSISPDGRRVWFATRPNAEGNLPGQSCGGISSVPLEGGPVTPLRTDALDPVGTYFPYRPEVSPDGRFVAYGRELCHGTGMGGVHLDLVTTDLMTGVDHVLAETPARVLAWSPDGHTLLSADVGEFPHGFVVYRIADDGTPTLQSHPHGPSGCTDAYGLHITPLGWSSRPVVSLSCGKALSIAEIDITGVVRRSLARFTASPVGAVSYRNGAVLAELYSSTSDIIGLDRIINGRTTRLHYVAGRVLEQW